MSAEDYIPDFGDGENTFEDYPHDRYARFVASNWRENPYNRVCNYCKTPNLKWKSKNDRWFLVDSHDKKHVCPTINLDVPKKKVSSGMDKNIAAFLRDDAKTIGVKFFSQKGDNSTTLVGLDVPVSANTYTYVTDLMLVVGDLVAVFANNRPAIAVVVRVDETLSIEPKEEIAYQWVISRIDLQEFKKNSEKNKTLTDLIAASYKDNMKKQFKEVILAGISDETKQLVNNVILNK